MPIITPDTTTQADRGTSSAMYDEAVPRGMGRAIFAGILLLVAGTLNIIYGIAAIDNANFFVAGAQFMFSDLNTWGWVTLILGALQMIAAFSIWRGGVYGIWFGVFMGCISAIASLLAIPAYPFWSLTIIAVDVIIVHGLIMYASDVRAMKRAV